MQELKSAANEMFKNGAIPTALDMYTNLLEYIFEKCQGEVDNHEIAVIYGNQAECLLKMGLYQEAFNAAIESVSYDGHWFKVISQVFFCSKVISLDRFLVLTITTEKVFFLS